MWIVAFLVCSKEAPVGDEPIPSTTRPRQERVDLQEIFLEVVLQQLLPEGLLGREVVVKRALRDACRS